MQVEVWLELHKGIQGVMGEVRRREGWREKGIEIIS